MKIDVSEIIDELGASTAFDELGEFGPVVVGGSEIRFPGQVRVRGVASNTGNGIYVEGTATGKVDLECSRCLRRFVQPFDVGFEALFVAANALAGAGGRTREEDDGSKGRRPRDRGEEGSASVDAEDMGIYPMEGFVVDVSEAVLAEVTLSLPMKPLCRPDCKGICPVCGQNLNEGECSCRPRRGDGLQEDKPERC